MKILLLISSFNSLSQAIFTKLRDKGYSLSVTFAINEKQMKLEIEKFEPQLILAPFLKTFISKEIYEKYPTYIFHPGPLGDRGPNSLEYALLTPSKEWGVVILRANELYDGGYIVAQSNFKVRYTYKASLYRQEIVANSLNALDNFFKNPTQITQILNPLHEQFKQKMRTIDWNNDTTKIIISKIHLSDSFPGVLDEIMGIKCYLFGAHNEEKLRGGTKEILAKRDGAICLGTRDGALWITHLKELNSFKLPATYVLKEKIAGIKEHRLSLLFDKSYETFYEISVEKHDNIAYLSFNFHNGAMSANQCIRLKYAFEYLKEESEIIVLVGGVDFFSNGIHLNILEDSKKQGEDGWSNINAMNDLIKSILEADEVVTIASLARNAGAGGVFMAIACDYVVAKENVILNPHYKTLGLSGSEYHTYTLPKRVGNITAKKLLDDALPISVEYAKSIGMIDKVIEQKNYYEELHNFALSTYNEDYIWNKQDNIDESKELMEQCKRNELQKMYPQFWQEDSSFHTLRYEFVYKICPLETPKRLKGEAYA
jgi:putative two-component system hydrogenase maturation factor HypX/HoxX